MVKYINPEMEVIAIETEDIVLASNGLNDDGSQDSGDVEI